MTAQRSPTSWRPSPGPIVLVGHSYGGAVITNAATGNSNVKALVYLDAFVPPQGKTIVELITDPSSCFAVRISARCSTSRRSPGRPEASTTRT
jgi:pimeloyl-ACP methyl ester carboxylesterase